MALSLELAWLPERADWRDGLQQARIAAPKDALTALQQLATSRMDFVRAGQLDKTVQRLRAEFPAVNSALPVLRLALLGSSNLSHLLPGIRLAALRRGFLLDIYTGPYGLYRQELADAGSALHAFRPEVVCFCFDAPHLVPLSDEPGEPSARIEDVLANLEYCWEAARQAFGCSVIQQTLLPRIPHVMGNNESRLASSQATLLAHINHALRARSEAAGVSLLTVDTWAAQDGLAAWFDAALWFSAKQEIHPRVSSLFGDQLGRLLAALRGRSAKCLVLDLDNTLWGGVIGDDGVEGIALGQGTPAGEAFLAFQHYARQLARRGVILAVCSKNDEANALAPFTSHPEMVLRRTDIACFVANWQDKAANLRHIAATLNIGLDALVFVDDNPAERMLIRAELPMVQVPEMPEDPAGCVPLLAAAGYFEALEITAEDRRRTDLYRANASREALRTSASDLGSYLQSLRMTLHISGFDSAGAKRIVQLINKTNQFNLTTRRYTDADVAAILRNEDAITLQLRLTDIHGDNGMIGVVIAYHSGPTLLIDTWLMSCRVLGRGVEEATLNHLVDRAHDLHCTRIHGVFHPTAKNAMVSDLYGRLGFVRTDITAEGTTHWELELNRFTAPVPHITTTIGDLCTPQLSIAS